MNIFAKAEFLSVAACAAAVTRPTSMVQREAALAELRAEREKVWNEQRRQSVLLNSSPAPAGLERDIRAVAARRTDLEGRIADLRRTLRPQREAHGQAVRKALAPFESQSARQALDAMEVFAGHMATLRDIATEIQNAHGSEPAPPMPALGEVELFLRSRVPQ